MAQQPSACTTIATSLVDLIASRLELKPDAYDRDMLIISVDYALRERYQAGYMLGRDEGRRAASDAVARRLIVRKNGEAA